MIENARRQLVLVALVIAAALALCIIHDFEPKLGIDLSGGTRLIYHVDIEGAIEEGRLAKDANPDQVMQETVDIVHDRIDPTGVIGPYVARRGDRDILIELPDVGPEQVEAIKRQISTLGRLEMRVLADYDYENDEGIEFDIAKEKERLEAWLDEGQHRQRIKKDPLLIRLFNNDTEDGPLSPYLRWYPHKVRQSWQDPERWEAPYTKVENADPGIVAVFDEQEYQTGPTEETAFLVELFALNMHEEHFTGEDLDPSGVRPTVDDVGRPAVGYVIIQARKDDYADWSEKYINKRSAIVLNGFVRIAPTFRSRIPGSGIIEGGFTQQEVEDLVKVLKTGSLKVRPTKLSEVTIGPTLGRQSIERGVYSIAAGGVVVLSFILLYYRLAGLVAFTAIVLNILLILGIMLFIRATLTLPGLGGLVLTMGMAVDANILIYERIREEKGKGKDILQAVRLGFERAMVTILDANITTFIAGVVLYNVGVGPVRGFAVTLMVGIATSIFTAFFISRLIFHYLVEAKRLTEFRVAEWLAGVHFHFLRWTRVAAAASVIVIVAGVANFASVPTDVKYGLDFTGGADLRVVLKEPMSRQELREILMANQQFREQFPNPQINRTERPDQFTIKLKLKSETRDEVRRLREAHDESTGPFEPPYKKQLRQILSDHLVAEAFSNPFSTPTGTGSDLASIELHFADPVDRAEVESRMDAKHGDEATVTALDDEDRPEAAWAEKLLIEFPVAKGTPPSEFFRLVREAIAAPGMPPLRTRGEEGTPGEVVKLSNPIPEAEEIGGRMVGELQTAAIGALLLSLFLIVMYIRVRFHEYKYGLAAVAALAHDVLVVLVVVTLFNQLGLVHAEIDLPMIAAFLTIIGYSINDTIVIFDRIRENLSDQKRLGDSTETFSHLINRSINQTLSRTILTSGTTLFVVLAQLVVNYGSGSALESFAFALIVGILSGTYSTIFVASPVVLWLRNREVRRGGGQPEQPSPAGKESKVALSGG